MALDAPHAPRSAPAVTFPRTADGYDPDAVDEFVVQLTARVELLKDLVREAVERSEAAEAALAQASAPAPTPEPAADPPPATTAGLGDVVVIAERGDLRASLRAAIDDAGGYAAIATRTSVATTRS